MGNTNLNGNWNISQRRRGGISPYLNEELITGADSDMSGPNNWIGSIGTPTFDINTTVLDNLYIEFTSGNEAIILNNILTIGEDNYCEIRLKKISGNNSLLQFGGFGSSEIENSFRINQQTTEYSIHRFTIRNALATGCYLGCANADNNGTIYAIDYIKVWSVFSDVETNETENYKSLPLDLNISDFLTGFTPSKTLTKFLVCGDSIMANEYGGTINPSDDETKSNRSVRMGINNIPRRIFDYIKNNNTLFNQAIYKRIDNAAWSFGNPSNWLTALGAEFLNPNYTGLDSRTIYNYSTVASEYVGIIIPDGYENCSFMFHRDDNELGADYDDNIAVTLNGGSIAAYGDSVINTYKAKYTTGDKGNPYYNIQYSNLPSGANTIRLTKSATTKIMMFWGAAYWTGNTYMLLNAGRGGYDQLNYYTDTLQSFVIDNVPDAVFYEIPAQNEASKANSLATNQKYFEYELNLIKQFTNQLLIYGTHPFGNNPNPPPAINYYTTYQTPNTFKEHTDRIKHVAYRYNLPYLDVFKRFETLILNAGGTLDGGEGGDTYTTDGQHPNTLCAGLSADYVNSAISDKLE